MTYQVLEAGELRDATPDEIAEFEAREAEAMQPPVPPQITSGQGREALHNAGLFANVQPAIDAVEDSDTKWRVQNAWDNRPRWEQQSPFVAMMAAILGLDDSAARPAVHHRRNAVILPASR